MTTCSAPGCAQQPNHESDVGPLCQHHFMALQRWGHLGSPSECSVEGCGKKVLGKGLCSMHYARLRKTGTTDDKPRLNARGGCSVEGCGSSHVANGLCDNHYRQQRQKRVRAEAREGAGLAPYGIRVDPVTKEPIERICEGCGGVVPLDRRPHGDRAFCSRECKQREAIRSGASAQASLRHHYRSKYGLSPEEVAEMRAGGCGVCGTHEWMGVHAQGHVDHDHATGLVRGVLCTKCNRGIGLFNDDPELLRAAADYLDRHVARQT